MKSVTDWSKQIVTHAREGGPEHPAYPSIEVQKIPSNLFGEEAMLAAAPFYRILSEEAELGPKTKVLDFGCGWGRISRFLLRTVKEQNISGVDVEPRTLQAARTAMPLATFTQIAPGDRLPFDDNSFDVAFSNSVFSHLSEASHRLYMAELARCLKSKGVLLISFLDKDNLERVVATPEGWLGKFIGDLDQAAKTMAEGGFFYKFSNRIENYGIAFASENWVGDNLPKSLRIEKFRKDYVQSLFVAVKSE
ncbi:class I SAM-dependent methyltransferase [Hyphomonas sp.]|uniref:class I SAM-dependent methyltransferase n=1 Tax=Alphaproteobacteria TaxID=28211 RepID=UPI003265524B